MSDPENDSMFHTKKLHRIWMNAEYDILTPEEVQQAKKEWDSYEVKISL